MSPGVKARSPRTERPEDGSVRAELLESALELFSSRGYAATSVREIVERAGVSKPVLYYHYGSKEGIFLEIMRWLEITLAETLLGRASGTGSAKHRLRGLCLDIYDGFSKNRTAVRFLNMVFWGAPQGAPAYDVTAVYGAVQRAFQTLADEGAAAGEFRGARPDDVAFAVIAAVSFTMDYELAYPEQSRGRDGLSRVLDLILSGAAKPRRGGVSR